VIWNSPLLPGFNDFNLEKIVLGNIYLPITALLEGEVFIEGFSTTLFIIKLFLSIFFFYVVDAPSRYITLINLHACHN
jgi:hypothetical protein